MPASTPTENFAKSIVSEASNVPYTASFVAVKLGDIGYVTLLYFVFAMLFARVFEMLYGTKTPEEYMKMPLWRLTADTIFHIFILGVIAYVLRNIVALIPSPLDGIAGFQHARLKELHGGFMLHILMILFQQSLIDKLTAFGRRVLGLRAGLVGS